MDTPSEAEVRRRLAAADATYEPFAPFSAWAHEPVGLGSWDDAAARLAEVRVRSSAEGVQVALDEVLRAAAVDTGAIEGLYAADRGFTHSVARHLISLDQAEAQAGPGFRRNFEAQLAGFERAVQLARGEEVITEAALRELHRVTCAGQDAYRVLTPVGWADLALPLGAYKTHPNHVQVGDGSFHAFAPVDRVPDEMHRLVEEMRSPSFLSAPATVQAAFSHHAFVSVHPFADGNGRVARLLASVWLLRAASIPLWVEAAERPRYIDALDAANRGDRIPFLRFVVAASLGLLREMALVIDTPPRPADPDVAETVAEEAAAAIAAEMQGLLGDLQGAFIVHPAPVTGPAPGDVWIPERATVALQGSPPGFPGVSSRGIAVGVAPGADDADRFCVLVFDRPSDGLLLREERLEAHTLLPRISPAGRRRLVQIAQLTMREAEVAHEDGRRGR